MKSSRHAHTISPELLSLEVVYSFSCLQFDTLPLITFESILVGVYKPQSWLALLLHIFEDEIGVVI
jgi:hypothetical protein